ncbi:hypothetical protein Vadar_016235 [Vaccinium darrowii]|uniref:Uncharacterized protein n=1 Tax=Vaccinium darrowii TaxID=229202 RepID=A0ACB7ZKL9_9ERIC|nr:hypothetical protein Vadar_016235 [Vaccinium darrowii]
MLFGKDRAMGNLAEGPTDIEDDDDEPVQIDDPIFDNLYTPFFENGEPVFLSASGNTFVDQSQSSTTANPTTPTSNVMPKPPKKKVKIDAKEAPMHEAMGHFMNQSHVVLEKLTDAMGFGKKLSTRKVGVSKELMKLDLDMDDRFVVTKKFPSERKGGHVLWHTK